MFQIAVAVEGQGHYMTVQVQTLWVVVAAPLLEDNLVQTRRSWVVAAGIVDIVAAVAGLQAEDTPVANLPQRSCAAADSAMVVVAIVVVAAVLVMMVAQHRVILRMFLVVAQSS
jgi:hypothetical protein